MILETQKTPFKFYSTVRYKATLLAKCDNCQNEFVISENVQKKLLQELHFCSKTCSNSSPLVQNKKKIAYIEHYGVENPSQSKEIRGKTENTCLERYGAKNPFQSIITREKAKETCLEHYGVDHPWKADIIREKAKLTCIKVYGHEHPAQSFQIKEKTKITNLKRHGVEFPTQNHNIYAKGKRTCNQVCIISHWKTGEKLSCTASYEVAFVNWCNANQIDFDWQIVFETPFLTPKGNKSIYIIDAYIKSGEFTDTWLEIKGWFTQQISRQKWEWFHSEHPDNSQLWNFERLKELEIL